MSAGDLFRESELSFSHGSALKGNKTPKRLWPGQKHCAAPERFVP